MVDSESLKHLIFFAYAIPSFFVYFMILYIIFFSKQKNKFSASFYRLFGISTVIYMIHAVTYYIALRLTSIVIFYSWLEAWPDHSFWYPILHFFLYYTSHGMHLYSLALSFNRVTVFILKVQYNMFWQRYLLPILLGCLLLPLLLTWQFPFLTYTATFNVYFGQWIQFEEIPWMDTTRNLFFEISITSALSLVFNLYSIFQLVQRRLMYKNVDISRQDYKMLIYTLIIFATEIFSCVTQYLVYMEYKITSFLMQYQFIVVDFTTLAPAWFIILTNKQLRREIINTFFGGHKVNIVTVHSRTVTVA